VGSNYEHPWRSDVLDLHRRDPYEMACKTREINLCLILWSKCRKRSSVIRDRDFANDGQWGLQKGAFISSMPHRGHRSSD
jgi:hypothetical protein